MLRMTKVSQMTISTHSDTITKFIYFADPSLMLSLTVDDHSQRLEKHEATLTRMEMLGKLPYPTCALGTMIHACDIVLPLAPIQMLRRQNTQRSWSSLFLDCWAILTHNLHFYHKVHLSYLLDLQLTWPTLQNHHILLRGFLECMSYVLYWIQVGGLSRCFPPVDIVVSDEISSIEVCLGSLSTLHQAMWGGKLLLDEWSKGLI